AEGAGRGTRAGGCGGLARVARRPPSARTAFDALFGVVRARTALPAAADSGGGGRPVADRRFHADGRARSRGGEHDGLVGRRDWRRAGDRGVVGRRIRRPQAPQDCSTNLGLGGFVRAVALAPLLDRLAVGRRAARATHHDIALLDDVLGTGVPVLI